MIPLTYKEMKRERNRLRSVASTLADWQSLLMLESILPRMKEIRKRRKAMRRAADGGAK